jgi:tetratricopeptide (TPR) repeat protein
VKVDPDSNTADSSEPETTAPLPGAEDGPGTSAEDLSRRETLGAEALDPSERLTLPDHDPKSPSESSPASSAESLKVTPEVPRQRRSTKGKLEQTLSRSARLRTTPPPPKKLGRYEIRGELGRGGVGVVYAAWDTRLQREIALKTLLAGRDASEVTIERFLREVRTTSCLRHQHIVSVHDAGVIDGHFYLAMDRIEGRSLAALLDTEGALEPRRAVDLLAPVARALAHAHREGFLHRDVKPENVLVDAEGVAYLTDFGLAADLKDGERLTQSNQALGTPAFMAPEQLRGKHRDPRVDVYALGATLYECVTGRVPFLAESYPELMHQVLTREPDPPRSLAPLLAPDLEAVIMTCLEKDPERRYPGPADLAADLERFQRGEAVRASLPTLRRRVWQRVLRHRAMALGTSVALVGVLSGGLGAFWIYRDAASEFRRTVRLEDERARLLQTQRERAVREQARSAASAEAALASTTEDAIQAYTRLLERYPESWEGRVARARLWRQRSRELRARGRDLAAAQRAAQSALEDLDQALREADRAALRLLKVELLRVDLRQPKQALAETRLVLGASEPALAGYAEARLAFAQGDMAAAEDAVRRALAARPLAPARLLLAELCLARDQPNEALTQLDTLAGRSDYAAEVSLLRGLALHALGSPQDAYNDAIRARELDPTAPRAHALLAELRLEQNNLGGALGPAKKAWALAPGEGNYALLLARTQLRLGDLGRALTAYTQALAAERPPSEPDVAALLAEAKERGVQLNESSTKDEKNSQEGESDEEKPRPTPLASPVPE